MTDIKDIYEVDSGSILALPTGVHVFARTDALEPLAFLADALQLHPLGVGDDLSPLAVAEATLAVIEVDPADTGSLARLDRLRAARPDLPVIVALEQAPLPFVRSLMRKGVADVLELPFASEELVTALVDAARAAPARRHEPRAEARLAPVIAVVSAAGGLGATTVATQLAPLLAGALVTNGRAAIVDLTMQSGDVASYFDKSPPLRINHLIESIGRVDEELMRSVAVECCPGADLIAAPEDIEPIETIPAEAIVKIVAQARLRYDVVVLDMPATLTNWAMSALLTADMVVLVGSPRIPVLRHVKRKLALLEMLGRHRDSIAVVLNRTGTGLFKRTDAAPLEDALGHPVAALLRDDPDVVEEAQLQGRLVGAIDKRSRLARDMADLAAHVARRIEGN